MFPFKGVYIALTCFPDGYNFKMKMIFSIFWGGPRGRAVKSAVSYSLDHLTAVAGVASSPALATCETSQVLLAGVPGGFSRGSLVFAPPTDWPVSYELKKNLERDVKVNQKHILVCPVVDSI